VVARVLLIDDSIPFRCLVRQILEKQQEFQVVGEAADGFEAVRQATQLKPDLILLDIALPKLDGIQAAKAILCAAPLSKIVFVTAYCSQSLAGTALHLVSSSSGAASRLQPQHMLSCLLYRQVAKRGRRSCSLSARPAIGPGSAG